MTDPSESVRERILAAARAEFAARGEEAASVRVIAEAAGVTAAMINYYFRGKRALHDAVVVEAQGRLFARLSTALPAGRGAGGSAVVAAAVAGAYFDFLAEDRELQRILLREVLDGGERNREFARRFVRPLRALLAEHFGEDEAVVEHAISLFGAVAGYFLYEPLLAELLDDDPLSPARLALRRRHVVELATRLADGPTATPEPKSRPESKSRLASKPESKPKSTKEARR